MRRNIPKVLAAELKSKKRGVVGISTTTDPYLPQEEKYKLTRYCLEQLLKYDFPVSILTKSALVTRDIDLLSKFPEIEVGFTITTIDDKERKILEPNADTIQSRISALAKCSKNGIKSYAFLGPLYPTMDEEKLKKLVENIKKANASCIMVDKLNLKPGIWGSVKDALKENPQTQKLWHEAVFGDEKVYGDLFLLLDKICHEQGIKFEDAWVSIINP